PFLRVGQNNIGLRVLNADHSLPLARAVLGMTFGSQLVTYPSNTTWKATSDSTLTQVPRATTKPYWSQVRFSDLGWRAAMLAQGTLPAAGSLRANPAVFEQPMPTRWLVAGAAPDAFFYGAPILPTTHEVWLRAASDGQATIYVNGARLTAQPTRFTFDGNGNGLPSRATITMGLYDITRYVHSGANAIAAHVAASGFNQLTRKPGSQPAALALDLIAIGADGTTIELPANNVWQSSMRAAPNWTTGGASGWAPATLATYSVFTAQPPYKVVASNLITPPSGAILRVAALASLALLALWALVVALLCWRRWSVAGVAAALERVALACAPPLALLGVLWALSLSPTRQSSLYTPLWLTILATLGVVSLALVILAQRFPQTEQRVTGALASTATRAATRVAATTRGWATTLRANERTRGVAPTTQATSRGPAFAQGARSRRWLAMRLRAWVATWTTASVATTLVVVALTALGAWMVTYQLGYESYWQDEMASIYAAQGILAHGIPQFPSGFIYPKAELYHYLLALVIAIFGSGPLATRSISAVEYIIMLPLVYLIGSRFVGRRSGLLALAIIVFSPFALLWAREARMYQQAELMVLIVMYLFYQAAQPTARTRMIYLSMAAVVVMYLSHEETFIVLPPLLLYFLATRRLTWVRNKHWWIAGGGALAIILAQLAVVKYSHPPAVGTDHTIQPMIGFDPMRLDYYARILFDAASFGKNFTRDQFLVMMTLALLATLTGWYTRDRALRYLSVFAFGSLLTLALLFYLEADRYVLVVLPALAMLAAAMVFRIVDAVALLARRRLAPSLARALPMAVAALLIALVLLAQIPGPANLSLAASRALGQPYAQVYPDYAQAGAYIRAHWEPGDTLIALAPQTDVGFYATTPTYVLYQDKSLSVMESHGHITDVYTGAQYLLSTQDFNQALASHHRIWLYTYGGYICCGKADQFPYQQYFRLAWEGYQVAVYLRGN
ncbi:MAG TPA: glycosyltransferase family 39 protein, partial [Ktedonobacterales bacterium]|nr:glycosyltransferase family 39 protein [Ktedonobacterales bacterium]